jgi:CHAD domain-containing protein
MYPDEPMAEAMRAALEPYARKLKKHLRKVARGDPDAIHDARTTIRRLREGLVVMGRTAFEPSRVARLQHRLRDLQKCLGPTRDDDVLLADMQRWMKRLDHAQRLALGPLEELLGRRRRKHWRVLEQDLRPKRQRRTVESLRRFLRGHPPAVVAPPKNRARAAPTLVRHFLADEVWRAYEEVLAFETRVASADDDVIHQVRSACRRLRYLLELLDGAVPPGAADVADALRALQDRLGELHDHVVAVALLEKWLADGRVPDNPAIAGYRKHHLRARERMRAEFEQEWRRLVSPAFRHAIATIASGEMRTRPDCMVRLVATA